MENFFIFIIVMCVPFLQGQATAGNFYKTEIREAEEVCCGTYCL